MSSYSREQSRSRRKQWWDSLSEDEKTEYERIEARHERNVLFACKFVVFPLLVFLVVYLLLTF